MFTTLLLLSPIGVANDGRMENPSEGGDYAGIQLFSGWVCDADVLEVLIDGAQYLTVPYGGDRLDTQAVCGDRNNGFGLLFNMANLGSGEHTVTLFADGQKIDESTFNVTRLSTGEFAEDLTKCSVVDGFPTDGKEVVLTWSEASQNFQIKSERKSALSQRMDGLWSDGLNNIYLWAERNTESNECTEDIRLYASGLMAANSDDRQLIDLFGSGSPNRIDMLSTSSDARQRELRFDFESDGTLYMRVIKCLDCSKTPEGAMFVLKKVLDPLDPEYLPPLRGY
jgi:hypothetical protein